MATSLTFRRPLLRTSSLLTPRVSQRNSLSGSKNHTPDIVPLTRRPLSTWAPPAMKALAFTGPATMDVSLASTNQSSTTVPATETQQQQQNLYSHIVPSFRRCRALVLDSSYRPIDVINWQRAICLDLFDKASLSSCIHQAPLYPRHMFNHLRCTYQCQMVYTRYVGRAVWC